MLFLILHGAVFVLAQQANMSLQDKLQTLLEQVFEKNENTDVEQLLQDLIDLNENPIHVDNAVVNDFSSLFILSPLQVEALLNYRDQYGPILTAYELVAIDGFNANLAELASYFLDFGVDFSPVIRRRTKQELLMRGTRLVEHQAGFKTRKFEGSPNKLYLRYRLNSNHVQLGFTGEKDAGESFFSRSNPNGFDYNSGFLRFEFGRKQSSLVVGDYVVQWGQGLTMWQGFEMGKSTDVDQISRFNQGIRPYSSTEENSYMRGVAGDLQFGKFHFQPLLSYKKFDANTDSIEDRKVFTSFQTSGLHRTDSEIEDKNSVYALVGGAHITYKPGRLEIGVSGVHTKYQFPLERADALYNQFLYEGKQITNVGLDYRYSLNRLYLFGEMASSFRGVAALNGFIFQPVGQVSFSGLYRNISKKYNSSAAAAFTENSRVNDEEGLFLGLRVLPASKLSLNAYADFFQYKWIKYTTAFPGKGHEFMLRADYTIARNWQLYARCFYESKPLKVSSAVVRYNEQQIRRGVRLQLSGDLSSCFSIRTRVEHSYYEHDHHAEGFMVSQDLGYHGKNERSGFWFRVAYFDTDDYDSRIYAYENDLLFQFSIPAFYGEGVRSYVNGKVKICEKIECWFKCSRTWFLGVTSLGSGDTAIDGSTRTEVKLQLRFRI